MLDRYRRELERLPADQVEAFCVNEIAKSLQLKDEYGFDEKEKAARRIFALRDALVSVRGMSTETRNLWHAALEKVESKLYSPS